MSTIQNLRKKLHLRLLQRQIRQHRFPRQSLQFDKAHTIGILFDGTDLDSRETVLRFAKELRSAGKSVKLLGYLDNRTESESFPCKVLNKRNLDWLLRPKGEAVADFLDHTYDILLNLSMVENMALEYIAALSKAHYRVGAFSKATHCYELMIDLPASQRLPDLIKQVEFFLQKMQSTDEAATV